MEAGLNIQTVLDYVEKHLGEDLSLERISKEFHYSKYYIARAFTHTYGKSFYQYVKARRMTVAAQALAETTKPIVEIAYEAHYSSQQAFTLAFHQEYLYTPQEYRRKGIFSPKQPKLALCTNRNNKGYLINNSYRLIMKNYLLIQKGGMAG